MTEPTPDPAAIDPLVAPPPAPGIAPLPAANPVPRSSGYGGPRVPAALVLLLAPVLAVAVFAGGVFAERNGVLGAPAAIASQAPSTGDDADLALIEQAWRTIHDNYVDPKGLDGQKMAYGAIQGMTEAVGDEGHTQFVTAEEAKAIDQSLSGQFVGIGVQAAAGDDDRMTIRSVFPNTPAEEAGLKRGDRILEVDGKTTEGETLDESISRVRGPEGEPVTLTIAREGVPDFDVTITRREYDLPLAAWAMVPGTKIALLRLDQFASGAADAVKDAIKEAKDAGATSIVFDLRGNPGGYVGEAVGVASQFLPDGVVYQAISRDGASKDNQVQAGGLATDIPLIVLTDGDTASSAEIVTGAIQDAGRGKVVGERTFGTGTVLQRFDLKDGSSLRIGVERWLTRDGRPIWHEGLDPDVQVALPDDAPLVLPSDVEGLTPAEFAKLTDVQVQKAVELLSAQS